MNMKLVEKQGVAFSWELLAEHMMEYADSDPRFIGETEYCFEFCYKKVFVIALEDYWILEVEGESMELPRP